MSDKHTCVRCGQCCMSVGRTFWKGGNFDNFPELQKRASNGDHEDGGLPCEMLEVKNSQATCILERDFGLEAKPDVCIEYPSFDESDEIKCIYEKQFDE